MGTSYECQRDRANKAKFRLFRISTRFLIRTPKVDLAKDMIIKSGGKSYEIEYINDYSYDRKYTEIMTKLVEK